jgi:hypothetical protein
MDDLWRLERDIESTNIWDAFITVWHASPGRYGSNRTNLLAISLISNATQNEKHYADYIKGLSVVPPYPAHSPFHNGDSSVYRRCDDSVSHCMA